MSRPKKSKNGQKIKSKSNLEQTFKINLGTLERPKELQIRADLSSEQRKEMMEFLSLYKDIFTWSYDDMIGLSTDNMLHKVPIKEGFKSVRQKLRKLKQE